jgi:hypothetical protein
MLVPPQENNGIKYRADIIARSFSSCPAGTGYYRLPTFDYTYTRYYLSKNHLVCQYSFWGIKIINGAPRGRVLELKKFPLILLIAS